ncbi:hypothetical protein B0T16DRAFT_20268 [Cercophora newfieldiana]|uniref:Secreted protein n=1 Tax=Cercophora newfieldiana TaxID=92897 RepID=A0AA40CZ43_9PEZI|nr:hypothetical protein B0T16DRAFT_20268 [Cercophora newfieldiana]
MRSQHAWPLVIVLIAMQCARREHAREKEGLRRSRPRMHSQQGLCGLSTVVPLEKTGWMEERCLLVHEPLQGRRARGTGGQVGGWAFVGFSFEARCLGPCSRALVTAWDLAGRREATSLKKIGGSREGSVGVRHQLRSASQVVCGRRLGGCVASLHTDWGSKVV